MLITPKSFNFIQNCFGFFFTNSLIINSSEIDFYMKIEFIKIIHACCGNFITRSKAQLSCLLGFQQAHVKGEGVTEEGGGCSTYFFWKLTFLYIEKNYNGMARMARPSSLFNFYGHKYIDTKQYPHPRFRILKFKFKNRRQYPPDLRKIKTSGFPPFFGGGAVEIFVHLLPPPARLA